METKKMLTIPRLRSGWRGLRLSSAECPCRAILVLALGLMVCLPKVSKAVPMGTAWTYQGRLLDANDAADGLYDFEFKIYDDPCTGTQQGSTVVVDDLDVIDGYFTVALDFSAVFDGTARWLETGVRPGASTGSFDTLMPRTELTPTPYAIYAEKAQEAADLTLPYSGTASSGAAAFSVTNTGSGTGVYGEHTNSGNYGQLGTNVDGVFGRSSKPGGSGVAGVNIGGGNGVYGRSNDGKGVHGVSSAGYAGYFGGRGYFSGNVGIGTTNPTAKLQADGSSADPIISGTNTGTGYAGNFSQTGSANTTGGLNVTTAAGQYGAKILNQGGYSGVNYGLSAEGTSTNSSVYGGYFKANTGGSYSRGIYIDADNTRASGGTSYGLQLYSDCANGMARGIFSDVGVGSGSTSLLYGIYSYGKHLGTSGTSYGIHSYVSGSDAGDSYGIYSIGHKYSSDTGGTAYGGYFIGDNDRDDGESYGLYTKATGANGKRYGLYSEVTTSSGNYYNYGLYTKVANNDSRSYGLYADLDPGRHGYGVYVDLDTTTACTSPQYGLYSNINHQGTGGVVYGVLSNTYSSNTTSSYAGYFSAHSSPGDTGSLYGIRAYCDGDTSGSKYAVYGYGPTGGYDFYAAGPGANYGYASSIRWKSDVRVIDDALGKVMKLRGVYFNWDAEHGGEHDVGMIAEEVGEVLPEIVVYEENGIDASGMDYGQLTPLLVEAVKALKIEVNELQKQHAEKDGVIDTLKQQNDKLEGRLAAMESSIATIAVQLKGGGK